MSGFIKLHKQMVNWQWYKDNNTKILFIDLLLDANFEESKSGFLTIKKGQVLTSLKRMSERTGLTYQEIRTSLSKLVKSGEINKQSTNANTIITIKNWCQYQESNKRATNEQQTINNIKEYKEEKEYKEINRKENIKEKIEQKYFDSLKVNSIFNEFLELRKKLKAVNSDRAISMLINKLNNYDEETQYLMIEQSIINSWKGIFELKGKRKDNVMETLKRIYNE